jgi:hypothetical protein
MASIQQQKPTVYTEQEEFAEGEKTPQLSGRFQPQDLVRFC